MRLIVRTVDAKDVNINLEADALKREDEYIVAYRKGEVIFIIHQGDLSFCYLS